MLLVAHRKPFRLLRIEGKLTKASAVYRPGLAAFLAKKIAERLRRTEELAERVREREMPKLEGAVINDVLMGLGWKVDGAWDWRKPAHINVLESRAYVGLASTLSWPGVTAASMLFETRALRPSLFCILCSGKFASCSWFCPYQAQHS